MTMSPKRLAELRKRKSWTQAQLAQAASLSTRTVQRAEAGAAVGPETLLALAGALSTSTDELCARKRHITVPADPGDLVVTLAPIESGTRLIALCAASAHVVLEGNPASSPPSSAPLAAQLRRAIERRDARGAARVLQRAKRAGLVLCGSSAIVGGKLAFLAFFSDREKPMEHAVYRVAA
ncbi:MAG: hypothetical protein A2138_14095 [Deltaproteobacteria bacterium RBG_16_71_12]|nr:MAG: hypothetical protein A2138_14095 [Deltaproteobacteria bacterium RBG_16_71_12]